VIGLTSKLISRQEATGPDYSQPPSVAVRSI
jgi:hypothetical protein